MPCDIVDCAAVKLAGLVVFTAAGRSSRGHVRRAVAHDVAWSTLSNILDDASVDVVVPCLEVNGDESKPSHQRGPGLAREEERQEAPHVADECTCDGHVWELGCQLAAYLDRQIVERRPRQDAAL